MYDKSEYEKRKEYRKEYYKKYYKENKEKYIKRNLTPKVIEYNRQHRQNLKLEIFSHYSNGKLECNCCGENNLGFLSIDHIYGNGNKQRIKLRKPSGYPFFSWLKKKKFPKGFQVLCMNCNWGRRLDGVCPHNRE